MRLKILLIGFLMVLLSCGDDKGVRKVTQVYPGGAAKSVVIFNLDETERLYQYVYYEDGKLKTEGSYSQDVRHGTWKSYYHSGELWTVNNYDLGILGGDYLMYNENRSLRIQGQYVNAEQKGVWTYNDDQGNLIETRDYGN
jgi:antitoxin component YwqK of YwqJK toxin-antitoxin module